MLMGEFKQEILKINNAVNMEIFNQGLNYHRVDIVGDKAIIIARNNRVKVLRVLDNFDVSTSRVADLALLTEFKRRFVKVAEEHFGVPILSFVKDYDPKLEMSVSVIFFEHPIEELLPSMNLPNNKIP